MINRLGIENLTMMGMPPVEYVRLASELGCAGVSLGLMNMPLDRMGYPDVRLYQPWSLEGDLALRRELKAALADTGIAITLGEGFRADPSFDVSEKAEWLDIFADLGCERINAVSLEPDQARAVDQLGKLADMAAARGMLFTIEFAPLSAIASFPAAIEAVRAIGTTRAKVLLDSMHFFRSGSTLSDLLAADLSLIGYAQLADAPLVAPEGLSYLTEATFGRAVPGTGELPLREWIAALPADMHIGIEAPALADLLAGMPPRDHAARAVAGARALGA